VAVESLILDGLVEGLSEGNREGLDEIVWDVLGDERQPVLQGVLVFEEGVF
jgi:hypothetical protein